MAAGIMLLAGIFGAFLNFISGKMLIKSAQGMSYDLRNTLFDKISRFSFSNFDKWRTGELMVRMNSDVDTVRMFVRMGLFMLFQSFFMIIGSLVAMYATQIKLANIMAVIMAGTLLFFLMISQLIRPIFLKMREALDKVNNVLQENLAGAKLVRALVRQADEKMKFNLRNRNLFGISMRVGVLIAVLFPLLMFIGNMALLITLWFGGAEVTRGAEFMTLGELVAFNNYAMMAIFPILMLAMVLNFISMALASAERIRELLDETPSLSESEEPVLLPSLRGEVEFINACFRYGEGERALDGFNLKISPGERIGVIGTTGSGKSTMVNLIPRYYDATSGSVLVDGIDVRELAFESLRGRIVTALQESVLFSGTIRENIRFGNPAATDEEVENAARDARALGFIKEKDNEWDEPVGERGQALSGGQRQRIALARSILSNPDILILDDITSALDGETESAIIENLYTRDRNMTIIIISQKISGVRNADRIIVMDKGAIIGVGSHDELLISCGMYREIEDTQRIMVGQGEK